MPKGATFANDILALVFNATPIADIAENDTSAPLTSLYLSFHTAAVNAGNQQTLNESAYTNYARVPVARTSGGWTVASATAVNAALVQFAQCGLTGSTITHVAIGTAASGAGKVLYSGALSASLTVSNQIQPQFAAGAVQVTEA
jgi:hypothetical protein